MRKIIITSFSCLISIFYVVSSVAQEIDWSEVGASHQAKIQVHMPSIQGFGNQEVELQFRLLSNEIIEKKGLRFNEERIKIKISCSSYIIKQTKKEWLSEGRIIKTESTGLYDIDVRHKDSIMFSLAYQLVCEDYIKNKNLISPVKTFSQSQIQDVLKSYIEDKN